MHRICTPPLLCALAFPDGAPAAQPFEVRDWFGAQLDRMVARGRALGLQDADLEEACYALVAFIDERVLRSSWPGREDWMKQPLQLLRHRENVAGENFFRRLRALLEAPRRLPAIQAYALCLALGFRGVYQRSSDAAALAKFQRAAFRRLSAALPPLEVSSPHLDRPPGADAPRSRSSWLLAPCAAVLAVVLVLVLCSWSVQRAGEVELGAPSSAVAGELRAADHAGEVLAP